MNMCTCDYINAYEHRHAEYEVVSRFGLPLELHDAEFGRTRPGNDAERSYRVYSTV